MSETAQRIAAELLVKPWQVSAALKLLDEGNTVPFIARYRKEATGGLDDTQLRTLAERATYLEELRARKETVLEAIAEQGKLDDALRAQIMAADTKARVEDLYAPFKKRRRTKADIAREAGLEPLADRLSTEAIEEPAALAEDYVREGFADVKAVLDGARAIVIDRIALNADLVGEVREHVFNTGTMRAQVVEGKEGAGEKYKDYFEFAEDLTTLPSHRILALLRAEAEGILTLRVDPGESAVYEALIVRHTGLNPELSAWLRQTVNFAWRTKLAVSAGVEARMRLKERAEEQALDIFSTNLRDVLLAAPAGEKAVLGMDPGYRNGVKCAFLSPTGAVLETLVVYPHQPQRRWNDALEQLSTGCVRYGVELIAIGNGTASRETTALARDISAEVKKLGKQAPTPVVISESGASVYSASPIAAEEFPDMDVSLRGAVSIARRLQDPLAELVKIDPKSIGVGQYQHDVNQTALARSLDAVVEDAVNAVGVDLNTASVPLLERVAGVSPAVAKNIVAYRDGNQRFTSRSELLNVPRLGPKAFEQCAGFLRIRGGSNPLDASAVHPEAYPVVQAIAQQTGLGVQELIGNTCVLQRLKPADFASVEFGVATVRDIFTELDKPGRDPRPAFVTAKLSEGVQTISDLTPGMIVQGTVSNVAAFGAFVDIGVHEDGLIHVSAMSHRFVKDPREVVKPGQVVDVKVLEVDTQRKRISLSLRLDDDATPASSRATQRKKRAPRKAGKKVPTGGAMADALRQAGLGRLQ